MSLRTINAPGVEIHEIDKSQYSQNLVGTNVLTFGFANKGQDYVTNEITSKSSWLNTYGEPETEAERYFYKSSMEIIEQGGKLFAAKIPYDNDLSDAYIGVKYYLTQMQQIEDNSPLYEIKKLDETVAQYQEIKEIYEGTEDDSLCREILNYLNTKLVGISSVLSTPVDIVFPDNLDTLNKTINTCFADLGNKDSADYKKLNDDAKKAVQHISKFVKPNMTEETISFIEAGEEYTRLATQLYSLTEKSGYTNLNAYAQIALSSFSKDFKGFDERFDEAWQSGEQNEVLVEFAQKFGRFAQKFGRFAGAVISFVHSPVFKVEESRFDDYSTGERKPENGEINIIDITRGKYGRAANKRPFEKYYKECLGIVPVITTAATALYAQMLLDVSADGAGFNPVANIGTFPLSVFPSVKTMYEKESVNCFSILDQDTVIPFGVESSSIKDNFKAFRDSMTMRTASYFPALYFNEENYLDREHLKKIGIVVLKAYLDPSEGNKINFDTVEAFVGELNPKAINPATKATTFIDNIVNSQSEYIRVFTNCEKVIKEETDILYAHNLTAGSLGTYEAATVKDISHRIINLSLDKIFNLNSDINEKAIDIVVDAGISNIDQFVSTLNSDRKGPYDPTSEAAALFNKLNSMTNTSPWRSILYKYDTFCKKTRKDCMYIADMLRPFALQGKKKIVRPSKPTNTIDTAIIPSLRYTMGTNSNYGAGYSDWFLVNDEFSGEDYWCPPSIQACGVYINTDLNHHYWDAPAGLNRGAIQANDVAFSPTIQQAGSIYLKNWNYAINYVNEGIILEGQKTFQTKPSAFDRVNVRRLFLRLERYVYQVARYFVYEPNTAYTRQRFVDQLTGYFDEVMYSGGMYDYRIICDESINTPEVIDNNELRVRIGIKPVKTIEFIEIQFVALRTGGSWEELSNI